MKRRMQNVTGPQVTTNGKTLVTCNTDTALKSTERFKQWSSLADYEHSNKTGRSRRGGKYGGFSEAPSSSGRVGRGRS